MVKDRAIVTTVDQYKVVYDLLIGAILMTLNDPNSHFKVTTIFDVEYYINGTR